MIPMIQQQITVAETPRSVATASTEETGDFARTLQGEADTAIVEQDDLPAEDDPLESKLDDSETVEELSVAPVPLPVPTLSAAGGPSADLTPLKAGLPDLQHAFHELQTEAGLPPDETAEGSEEPVIGLPPLENALLLGLTEARSGPTPSLSFLKQEAAAPLPASPIEAATVPVAAPARAFPGEVRSAPQTEVAPGTTSLPPQVDAGMEGSSHAGHEPAQTIATDSSALTPSSPDTAGEGNGQGGAEKPASLSVTITSVLPLEGEVPDAFIRLFAGQVATGGLAPPPPAPAPATILPIDPPSAALQVTGLDGASFEVSLPDLELGQVRLEMTRTGEILRVVIAAERADTLDLLRRNAETLMNELRLSGMGDASLSFGSWQQGTKTQDDRGEAAFATGGAILREEDAVTARQVNTPVWASVDGAGRLHIRI